MFNSVQEQQRRAEQRQLQERIDAQDLLIEDLWAANAFLSDLVKAWTGYGAFTEEQLAFMDDQYPDWRVE